MVVVRRYSLYEISTRKYDVIYSSAIYYHKIIHALHCEGLCLAHNDESTQHTFKHSSKMNQLLLMYFFLEIVPIKLFNNEYTLFTIF